VDHLGATLNRVPVNGGQLPSTTGTVTAIVELFRSPGGATLSNQVAGNVKSDGQCCTGRVSSLCERGNGLKAKYSVSYRLALPIQYRTVLVSDGEKRTRVMIIKVRIKTIANRRNGDKKVLGDSYRS